MAKPNLTPEEEQALFEYVNNFIKRSHYISSVLDSQRIASAQAMAIIMKALTKHDPSLGPIFLEAVNEIESKTFVSPSIDGDRSLIARAIREELRQFSSSPAELKNQSRDPALTLQRSGIRHRRKG